MSVLGNVPSNVIALVLLRILLAGSGGRGRFRTTEHKAWSQFWFLPTVEAERKTWAAGVCTFLLSLAVVIIVDLGVGGWRGYYRPIELIVSAYRTGQTIRPQTRDAPCCHVQHSVVCRGDTDICSVTHEFKQAVKALAASPHTSIME